MSIIYKDILEKLNKAGYSSSRIRKEKLLSESTLTRIRNNKGINTDTLNTICKLIGCTLNDIVDYKDD